MQAYADFFTSVKLNAGQISLTSSVSKIDHFKKRSCIVIYFDVFKQSEK